MHSDLICFDLSLMRPVIKTETLDFDEMIAKSRETR